MAEGVGYATSARSLPKRHSRTAPSGFLTIIRSSNPFWRAKPSPLWNKAGRRVRLGIGEMRTSNERSREDRLPLVGGVHARPACRVDRWQKLSIQP